MRSTLSTLRPTRLLALGVLLAPLALAAPTALADRCDSRSRSSVFVRTSSSYDRGYDRGSRDYSRSRSDRGHASAPSGYYKKVYRPAIYRTVYDHHGRARRVCVRAARYDRVWVSTGRSHHRSRW